MKCGGSATGNIETSGDADWFRITLTAGHTYRFDLQGSGSGHGTLSDPLLQLLNSTGTQLTSNDDYNGLEPEITYTPTTSDTYYLSAQAYDGYTGTYLLSARDNSVRRDFNGDGKADILWQNTSGTPAIWAMNGTNSPVGAALPNPGPTWHATATGDFNGDGKSDILWQNDNGTPAIWDDGRHHRHRCGRPLPQSWTGWHVDQRPAISTATARPTSCGRTTTARRRSG